MKRFLIRACVKLACFFWSWGFLKFVLWTVTLVILFYAEEDWRGARAWAATKAKWEAKGESFDYNKFIPPPIPDNENLAAIPLFKLEPDPKNKGELAPLVLQRALRDDLPGNDLNFPNSGNWTIGQVSEMKKIREGIATDYVEAFKTIPPSNDSLTQFDALYPFIADLRAASASRPDCRFPHDYPPQPPYDFLRMVTVQIQMAKVLNLHALLALDAHQPDLALADIQTSFKLIAGLRQEPFLVSGLVAVGMTAINFPAVYDGLTLHSWNDAQLADLENDLVRMDFLADYQHCLRGEFGVSIPTLDNLKGQAGVWPHGWIDLWKVQAVNIDLNAVRFVDPKARRVLPKIVDPFAAEIEQRQAHWYAYAPWNIFSSTAAGPIAGAAEKFAQSQVWVDEARIACALERYRLAHGVYPDALEALAPAYINEVPHDIMNDGPYHYRLRSDGTFLLYSVGWNQIDEGGKVVFKKDAPTSIDYLEGDWVWPTPQPGPGKSR